MGRRGVRNKQRQLANISLGVLLALLVLALTLHRYGWSIYLRYMALAGLAGGIADWYAVTALFRHPLGIKWLPHTSIISANRERIINALATLVETELLSVSFLETQLNQIPVTEWISAGLERPLPAFISEFFQSTLRPWLQKVPAQAVADWIQSQVQEGAQDVSMADLLVSLIRWLIQSGYDRELFQFLSEQVRAAIDNVEFTDDMAQRLKLMIEQYTKTGTQKFFLGLLESLGTVDYHELSVSVKTAMMDWLQSEQAFEQFDLILVRTMLSLRDNPAVRARVDGYKRAVLAVIPWPSLVRWALKRLDQHAEAKDWDRWAALGWQRLAVWWRSHPEQQAAFVSTIKHTAVGLVRQYHPVLGRLVRDHLNQMDEREWIDKIEWYVGQDLQWIRVNGAIVGGLVGLLITLVTHWL
jgi:uncharacterized membrane-anchored protein YjiN (DUF445 family)